MLGFFSFKSVLLGPVGAHGCGASGTLERNRRGIFSNDIFQCFSQLEGAIGSPIFPR
jgi:hypothetical protein